MGRAKIWKNRQNHRQQRGWQKAAANISRKSGAKTWLGLVGTTGHRRELNRAKSIGVRRAFEQIKESLAFVWPESSPERHRVQGALPLCRRQILEPPQALAESAATFRWEFLPALVKAAQPGALVWSQTPEDFPPSEQSLFLVIGKRLEVFLTLAQLILLFGWKLLESSVALLKLLSLLGRDALGAPSPRSLFLCQLLSFLLGQYPAAETGTSPQHQETHDDQAPHRLPHQFTFG